MMARRHIDGDLHDSWMQNTTIWFMWLV